MDPIIGASLISAGSGIVQGIGNLFGGGSANRNARKMMREQMAYNERMWQKEKDWTLDMWNKNNAYNEQMWHQQNAYNEQQLADQRAYNDPSAQMERMQNAGINPYMAVGGVSSGNVEALSTSAPTSSAPSTPSAPSHPGVQQQPLMYGDAFKGVFDFASNAIRQQAELKTILASARKVETEANMLDTQAAFQEQMLQKGIALMNEQIQGHKSDNEHKFFDLNQKKLTSDLTYRQAVAQTTQAEQGVDLNRLTMESLELQNTAQKLRIKYLPQELAVNLATLRQNLSNMVAQGHLTHAQAALTWSQEAKTMADTAGVQLNNKFLRETFGTRSGLLKNEFGLSQVNYERNSLDNYYYQKYNSIDDIPSSVLRRFNHYLKFVNPFDFKGLLK